MSAAEHRHGDTDGVLQHQEHHGRATQDGEAFPPGLQRRELGGEADGGEEDQKQHVPRTRCEQKFEPRGLPEREDRKGGEDAPEHRDRQAHPAQKADPVDQEATHTEGEQSGDQRSDLVERDGHVHGPGPSLRKRPWNTRLPLIGRFHIARTNAP